jgi:hypothetical protein
VVESAQELGEREKALPRSKKNTSNGLWKIIIEY